MNSTLKNGTKTQEPQRLLGFWHTYRSWIQCTMLFSAQKQAGQEQGVRPVCMQLIGVTGKRQGKFRRSGNLKRRVFCGFGGDFCRNIRICSHKKASRRIDLPFSSVDCPDFIKQWGFLQYAIFGIWRDPKTETALHLSIKCGPQQICDVTPIPPEIWGSAIAFPAVNWYTM